MFLMSLLKELIDIVILCHIALDEAGGWNLFCEIFASGFVDVAELDLGSLLAQDANCSCAYASRTT